MKLKNPPRIWSRTVAVEDVDVDVDVCKCSKHATY